MAMKINYVKGDLFAAIDGSKNILVPHCCNDIGGWGTGFVVAISKFDKNAEMCYRSWYAGKPSECLLSTAKGFALGETQVVPCKLNTEIVNMVGQYRNISQGERVPVRYWAIARCMRWLALRIKNRDVIGTEIWAPKFCAGLARGNWDFIEALINEIWVAEGIPVTIYEL
jgi:hypothetical protein